jgi:septum site-determining protein MinD
VKSITFAVSKGGVGKSLITANVGAALAEKGKKVVLVEGDPNQPLQVILGVDISSKDLKLDNVVKNNLRIEEATYPTEFDNLFLIPSGVSLQGYFEVNSINFAKKLVDLKADFMFIDVPFPLGEAAFLSLGVCEYSILVLTEDEFVLCVESAIDTIRLGRFFLKCVPLGFVLNRIKTPEKFTKDFIEDLENLLEIPCIAQIEEDQKVSKSYGGVGSHKAFLAYHRFRGNDFKRSIDEIANMLLGKLPDPEKKDVVSFIGEIIEQRSKL